MWIVLRWSKAWLPTERHRKFPRPGPPGVVLFRSAPPGSSHHPREGESWRHQTRTPEPPSGQSHQAPVAASVGELAITPNISLVAVCCSKRFLEFLEQPNVLDGDDRLVGEGLQQFDLLFRKGSNFGPANHDSPDGHSLAQQRRGKYGASTSLLLKLKPSGNSVSDSVAISCMWIVCRSTTARPATDPRLIGVALSTACPDNWPIMGGHG